MQDKSPRVSIVTPSFNQAPFLEETIRSVLEQDYPNVEYMVIDGGSTDGSVEIIRKYADRLAYWVSETDNGQAHAINKGWRRATGDVVAYLNSDDIYYPGAIRQAVDALGAHPDVAMIYSDAWLIDEHGRQIRELFGSPFDMRRMLTMNVFVSQPTTFIRRHALDTVGLLDERLHMVMDFDLWLRLGLQFDALFLSGVHLAAQREHGDAKSSTSMDAFALERYRALNKVFAHATLPSPIRDIREEAYAAASFIEAEQAAYLGVADRIVPALLRAFVTDPQVVLTRPALSAILAARGLLPWWSGKPSPVAVSLWRRIAGRTGSRPDTRQGYV